jgi:RNA polymerase sigma-70 factor (ECF subfamily)
MDATLAARPLWQWLAGAAVGVGLITGLIYSSTGSTTEKPAEPQAPPTDTPSPQDHELDRKPAASSATSAEPNAIELDLAAPQPDPKAPSIASTHDPRAKQAAAPNTPASTLAEEVALLSKATSALHSGQASRALNILAEHQRKFPRGALAAERRGARAQALCQLGRKEEARATLQALSPSSPLAARAKSACDFD